MKRHNLTLASTRVHVLNLCPMKAPCFRSMFHLLCRISSCSLDTSPSSCWESSTRASHVFHVDQVIMQKIRSRENYKNKKTTIRERLIT
ncbi:hypothetical protein GW17_00023008 [Ensete ventricosum]|nr:hypothetical protein GW17_00023008 [Ensete ventricosum]